MTASRPTPMTAGAGAAFEARRAAHESAFGPARGPDRGPRVTRRCRRLLMSGLLGTTFLVGAASSVALAAVAEDDLLDVSGLTRIGDDNLAQLRGGFSIGGFNINFGVMIKTMINDVKVLQTSFKVEQLGKMSDVKQSYYDGWNNYKPSPPTHDTNQAANATTSQATTQTVPAPSVQTATATGTPPVSGTSAVTGTPPVTPTIADIPNVPDIPEIPTVPEIIETAGNVAGQVTGQTTETTTNPAPPAETPGGGFFDNLTDALNSIGDGGGSGGNLGGGHNADLPPVTPTETPAIETASQPQPQVQPTETSALASTDVTTGLGAPIGSTPPVDTGPHPDADSSVDMGIDPTVAFLESFNLTQSGNGVVISNADGTRIMQQIGGGVLTEIINQTDGVNIQHTTEMNVFVNNFSEIVGQASLTQAVGAMALEINNPLLR